MTIARPTLAGFRAWLDEHGLAPGTCDEYVRDLHTAQNVNRRMQTGLVTRLRDDALAPKTRRRTLAAGRRWADYTRDEDLRETLKKIRLPPARRKSAKVPLAREQLFALIDELDKADVFAKPMRAVIGMMACRGLRCGDVLRLHADELAAARDTGVLAYEAKGRRRLEFKVLKTYRRWLVMLGDAMGDNARVAELIAPGGIDNHRAQMKAAAKAVERALAKIAVAAGIFGLYPHRLRRTYAVEYLRSLKGDPEAIMKLTQHMQWASVATAMEYVDHARGDELNEAAERIFDRDV